MNRIRSMAGRYFPFLLLAPLLLTGAGCKSDDPDNPGSKPQKEVTEYPERETKVYMGRSNTWSHLGNPANYPQWEYTRQNVCFYTNFIDMWVINFQEPTVTPAEKIKRLSDAFTHKDCFFETSMELAVNGSLDGYNNDVSDKRSIDQLQDNGFAVDYVSMNYMTLKDKENCLARLDLARTYKGNRKVLALLAPWRYNGDLTTEASEYGATARESISWTDGGETDGPLGFWVVDQDEFRAGSYSVVRFLERQKKESAIMLAPYAASVDPARYDPGKDFLKVSKECVLGHEDNLSAPDIWTIWGYNGGTLPNFPECETVDGQQAPVNSLTGVAFWLHHHLFDFPVLSVDAQSNADATWTDKGDNRYELRLAKGKTFVMQVEISNDQMPQIELTPVIRAVTDVKNASWDFVFKIDGKDVTETILYDGGVNFVRDLRLSNTRRVALTVEVKANPKATGNSSLGFEVMSNLTNSKAKKNGLSIDLVCQ